MPLDLNYTVTVLAADGKIRSRVLDVIQSLAQLSVLSRSTTTPPSSANENDIYIVPSSSASPWTAYTGSLAIKKGGDWIIVTPISGWLVWVQDEALVYTYNGSTWVLGGIQGPQGNQGIQGPQGDDGQGVPTGGSTGQILAKASVADFDSEWIDCPVSPPVGAVVAWLKSFTNTPALPGNWVECNGQVLSDGNSVYDGQTLPNLNASGGGAQQFLRGSTTSGSTGGADTHTHGVSGVTDGHTHTTDSASDTVSASSGPDVSVATSSHTHNAQSATDTFAATSDSASSLPSYYEVVYIMRIK